MVNSGHLYMEVCNMELRKMVLEAALHFEAVVTDLLMRFLDIGEDRKALGNRSEAIPYNNKIGLLYDIGVIDEENHKRLLLISQIRNQFVHNPDCSSFQYLWSDPKWDYFARLKRITGITGLTQDDEDESKKAFQVLIEITVGYLRVKKQEKDDRDEKKAQEFRDLCLNSMFARMLLREICEGKTDEEVIDAFKTNGTLIPRMRTLLLESEKIGEAIVEMELTKSFDSKYYDYRQKLAEKGEFKDIG